MELSKMSYHEVRCMPVYELQEYAKWKLKYDEDREKSRADSLDQIK